MKVKVKAKSKGGAKAKMQMQRSQTQNLAMQQGQEPTVEDADSGIDDVRKAAAQRDQKYVGIKTTE